MLSEVPNLDDTSCRVVVRHEDPTAATAGSLSPLTPSRAANSSTFFRMPDTPSKCRRTNHHRFIQLQSNALRQRAQQHTVSNSCSSVPHGGGVPTQVVAMSTNGHTKKHPRLESCFAESAMYTSCDSVEREMSRVNLHNNNCSSPSTTPALPAALSSSQLRLSQPGCPDGGFSQRTDISQETTMSQLLTKKVLTEYTEMCELGHGSFGRVILARENATNTLYAIKECPVEQTKHGERKMRQERDIMILVRSFPHCVLMSSYWLEGQSHPKLYLQVQYCPGGNVANEAHRRRALNQPWAELEILTFLGQMAMALDAMHTANVVHVDFKPENVLIDHARNYFLADFGCALFLDEHTGRPVLPPSLKPQTRLGSTGESQSTFLVDRSTDTQASQDEGDCRYAATDMINQKECYPAGDVFSVGISLYELMSGKPLPRREASYHALRTCVEELPDLRVRGYSPTLVHLVSAMMHQDPYARPTMRQVLSSELLSPAALPSDILRAPTGKYQDTEMRFASTVFDVSRHLVFMAINPTGYCAKRQQFMLDPPAETMASPSNAFVTPRSTPVNRE